MHIKKYNINMVKFLSNKKPPVQIGGKGTYTPTIRRLVVQDNRAILARFKSNGAIADVASFPKRRHGRK